MFVCSFQFYRKTVNIHNKQEKQAQNVMYSEKQQRQKAENSNSSHFFVVRNFSRLRRSWSCRATPEVLPLDLLTAVQQWKIWTREVVWPLEHQHRRSCGSSSSSPFCPFFGLAEALLSVGVSCLDRAVQRYSGRGDSKGGSSDF
jgi:hypothetical protein